MLKQWLTIAALVFCPVTVLRAQNTSVSGLIMDQAGGMISGVKVTLTSMETGVSRATLSDDGGRYQYSFVPSGLYQISAEYKGFRKELRTGIRVTIERNATIHLTLGLGEVNEEITVTAAPSAVETLANEVGGLVDERRVSDLPLNGRDWLQLAELHPGVVRARSTGNANTSNSFNARISVSGQRPNATNFALDGTDVSVYSQARPPGSVAQGLVLGVEAILEFRIVTSGYSAEYGNKSGGLVDVVTKSGTNDLHGSAYWFHRNDNLDARNFFDQGPVPEFRRHQFGASIGGPAIRNRTFFFLNYEALREAKGDTSGDVSPNADARRGYLPNPTTGALEFVGVDPSVAPFLALYPLPNGPDFGNGTGLWTGSADRRMDEDFFTGRIDHRLSGRDSLFGRHTIDDSRAFLPFGGNAPFPGFPRSNAGRDQVLTIGETHTFSPSLVNTLRLGFNRRA
ncbi:MAG: carboxypeptidase regulatory-like domain-containing protein, partial [Acidobacteria bacterium]|nr:carboxypeptidase regulatory-like domain-containing protein [Acidobacteriota bacterium]